MIQMTLGRPCGILALAFLVAISIGAQEAPRAPRPDQFRFERQVRVTGNGPCRLEVDVPLLAGARPIGGFGDRVPNGLEDLRLYDADGREVPYLLVWPRATSVDRFTARVLPIQATKESSGFEADFGQPRLIERLQLEGLTPPFVKKARVEASGDRTRWTIVQEVSVFHLPAERVEQTSVALAPGDYRFVRVTWDDSASARLPLPSHVLGEFTNLAADTPELIVTTYVQRRPSEPGLSRYRIRLPAARLPVSALDLHVADRDVLRDARVLEGQLQDSEVAPVTIGKAELVRRSGVPPDPLRVQIGRPTQAALDLVISDHDNPPLDVRRVSAVLRSLPVIYFETQDARPLVARFGQEGVAAPHYDLEARRASVRIAAAGAATWGERRDLAPAQAPANDPEFGRSGAPLDLSAFRYSRDIAAAERGLAALALDESALAHARYPGFSDLRIVDGNGRQVPYLLERLDEPRSTVVGVAEVTGSPRALASRLPAKGKHSLYRLDLPFANLPAGKLVMSTRARVFERPLSLLAIRTENDPARRSAVDQLAHATWRHTDPDSAPSRVSLDIPTMRDREVWLIVDEGDNEPLPLGEVSLLLPAWQVRFFHPGDGPLRLVYGSQSAASPRYDLSLLRTSLLGAPANEVAASAESSHATDADAQRQMAGWIFWTALIVAVVVLLALVALLVRKTTPA